MQTKLYWYLQKVQVPRASSCFFPDPGGRPLLRFAGGSEEDRVPVASTRPAADETGVGDKPSAMLPSGAYFLGRPLFFLEVSMLKPQGRKPDDDPSPKGESMGFEAARESKGKQLFGIIAAELGFIIEDVLLAMFERYELGPNIIPGGGWC